jgi:YidC/Oxa1 family membrane protein insertase
VDSLFSGVGDLLGMLFSPIHTVFQYVFLLPVFNIWMLIYQGVHSFGLSIILLTLLIRGSLYPLTRKQLASSRKMQELAPKLKELQKKHRGDTQGMVAAQQALYKEHGVSMYGGCLPLLIQMPFLYALYYSFEQVLMTKGDPLKAANEWIYPFLPHLTTAPETTFLGFSLIAPSFVLALLAGVLTFVQMRMALPIQPAGAATPKDATSQATRSMQYIMPFFTFFIGTRFPAGLALYWAVSTGFSAAQQYFISGWGSLWVGVPGMERFVPKPPAAPAPTLPDTGARRASGAAAPEPEPTKGGFFSSLRESIRQIQEQAAAQGAADRTAAEARRAESERVVEGSLVTEEPERRTELEAQTERARQQKNVAGGRDRRSRGAKSGVTLVRPPASRGADAAAPETRVAQENSGAQPSDGELPEKRIAREAAMASSSTNGGQTSGGSGSTRSGAKGGSGKSSGQNGHGGARGPQQSGSRNRSRGSR